MSLKIRSVKLGSFCVDVTVQSLDSAKDSKVKGSTYSMSSGGISGRRFRIGHHGSSGLLSSGKVIGGPVVAVSETAD